MPLYEFHCRTCGEDFEEFVFPSEPEDAIPCPSCGTDHPERRLSVFGVGTEGATSPRSSASSCGTGSFG
jgi:putative FmdB family regulatory protein